MLNESLKGLNLMNLFRYSSDIRLYINYVLCVEVPLTLQDFIRKFTLSSVLHINILLWPKMFSFLFNQKQVPVCNVS